MKDSTKANQAQHPNNAQNANTAPVQPKEPEVKEEVLVKFPLIFSTEHINQIFQSKTSIEVTSEILKSNYRRMHNKADYDNHYMLSQAEFHVNTLIFLKESFPKFPDNILSKLLNLFADLISLPNFKYNIDASSNDSFLQLSKVKLTEFKEGLKDWGLIPTTKEQIKIANNPNKPLSPEGKFYISYNEIARMIGYIQTSFLPFLRIWFYCNNDKRTVVDKKIEVIINKPIVSLSLNAAIEIKEPVVSKEDSANKGTEKDKAEDKKETEKAEEKKEDKEDKKPQTYLDLLNKMDLNAETKKIIIEKIEELNKEVDTKISDRQKQLDDKVKEMEDTVKGKKK